MSTVDTGIENVHEVLVVGAGAMGSQIAMVCALAGYRATATDLTKDALNHAQTQLRQRVGRTVEKGRLTRDDAAAAFDRLTLTTDLDAAAARADFVIEAAVEKLDVKREVFARLDAAVPEHTILTTNSSNPVVLRKEIPGFVANRILNAVARRGIVPAGTHGATGVQRPPGDRAGQGCALGEPPVRHKQRYRRGGKPVGLV